METKELQNFEKIIELAGSKGYDMYRPVGNIEWHRDMCMLQWWLRNQKDIIIAILLDQTSYPKYAYEIVRYKDRHTSPSFEKLTNLQNWGLYRSYEDALEYALLEALNYI